MFATYEYRIYPTKEQLSVFNKTLGLCRLYYNLVVEHKNKDYRMPIEGYKPTFTKFKPEALGWLNDVDSMPLGQVWSDVRGAYTNFFSSIQGSRKGKVCNRPTFKCKKICKASFRYPVQKMCVGLYSKGLYVSSRLGYIKIAAQSQFCEGKWKNITFKRSASGKWYVKICVELKEEQTKIQNGKAVGIDWNCSDDSFLTMSDGTKVKCPRFLKRKEKQLEKYQQVQSRRFVKGKDVQSKRYYRAKSKVARLHEKVANQRRDWLHKVSRELANKYEYVFVEDINMQKMSAEKEHGRTVGDQGFGLLRQYLSYKTNLVKVPAQYTSKTCNVCGIVNKDVVLGVKQWVCPVCSTQHDRDINAARNILYLGVKKTLGGGPAEVLNNARLQNRECPKPSVV
ncbi:MAG: transposase [Clostridia bacterium]|nr:transposase [Clostridia bacterium]